MLCLNDSTRDDHPSAREVLVRLRQHGGRSRSACPFGVKPKEKQMALLDSQAAADYLGMSKSWMETARSKGKGPHVVRLGHKALYRQQDLDQFIADNLEPKSMQK